MIATSGSPVSYSSLIGRGDPILKWKLAKLQLTIVKFAGDFREENVGETGHLSRSALGRP
jgi:hypothetical protein